MRFIPLLLLSLTACSADTDSVVIELAPDVVSSIDGTLGVRATAFADRAPASGETISITVAYTDRNGTSHDILPIEGETNDNGVFEGTVTGLTWDGIGTITATLPDAAIEAKATFSVLDRTPPTVTITPPANNQVRVGADVRITVHAKDEIGISQVYFEAGDGNFGRDRATLIASGSIDAIAGFDFKVPDAQPVGSMITLHALAADLSGNLGAAAPITVTVVAP